MQGQFNPIVPYRALSPSLQRDRWSIEQYRFPISGSYRKGGPMYVGSHTQARVLFICAVTLNAGPSCLDQGFLPPTLTGEALPLRIVKYIYSLYTLPIQTPWIGAHSTGEQIESKYCGTCPSTDADLPQQYSLPIHSPCIGGEHRYGMHTQVLTTYAWVVCL